MLAIGDAAPAIRAQVSGGGSFDLKKALKKGRVLLYFYPKAFTPT